MAHRRRDLGNPTESNFMRAMPPKDCYSHLRKSPTDKGPRSRDFPEQSEERAQEKAQPFALNGPRRPLCLGGAEKAAGNGAECDTRRLWQLLAWAR
jgi:hypothetical protein